MSASGSSLTSHPGRRIFFFFFLNVATHSSASNKAPLSSLFRQMFCGMEERKSQFFFSFFFFFLFSVGGPLRPLSLCLLSDERLMECCSARPEPTPCVQKVTESALVY